MWEAMLQLNKLEVFARPETIRAARDALHAADAIRLYYCNRLEQGNSAGEKCWDLCLVDGDLAATAVLARLPDVVPVRVADPRGAFAVAVHAREDVLAEEERAVADTGLDELLQDGALLQAGRLLGAHLQEWWRQATGPSVASAASPVARVLKRTISASSENWPHRPNEPSGRRAPIQAPAARYGRPADGSVIDCVR